VLGEHNYKSTLDFDDIFDESKELKVSYIGRQKGAEEYFLLSAPKLNSEFLKTIKKYKVKYSPDPVYVDVRKILIGLPQFQICSSKDIL